MRCVVCKYVFPDAEDLCPSCLADMRPLKQTLGLPITDAKRSYSAMLESRQAVQDDSHLNPPFSRPQSKHAGSAAPILLKPGDLFAERFYIDAPLGQGAVGTVYAAQDALLGGERVAIKILHPELTDDGESILSFLREVRLARRIESHQVVRIFDAAKYNGLIYFTMELVEGRSLANLIADGPIPTDLARRILIQIVQGVGAMHAIRILHQDLKSENVLIDRFGDVKIGDFGVARFGPELTDSRKRLVGSAPYMAPEIWMGQGSSVSTDLYALGILGYELLTGQRPFEGESQAILLLKHLKANPISPTEVAPSAPAHLSELVIKLLAKAPENRPKSAQELLEILTLDK